MSDVQDNIAYGNVESNEVAVERHIYELPEMLTPEPISSWSSRVVNDKKWKRGHHFNIFITVLAVISLLLALITLIIFLVYFSSSQLLIETLWEQLSISNQQNEENVSELREQLNNSSQQNKEKVIELQEAVQDYVQDLERRLNNTDYEIQKLSSDLRGHVQSVEEEVEILKMIGERKVAEINMTDPTQQCPDGFKQINRTEPPLRTCGRPDGNRGCVSTTFPVNGIEYSHVRGRIIAYQIGTPSAFGSPSIIDSYYVAGISLTHGQPRQHIWSFANARGEGFTNEVCPCIDGSMDIVPEFVGTDYFCDSAIRGTDVTDGVLYPDDPLWDGQGCGSQSTCCEFNNPPWFCKQLPQPTTDDIEMRLCENSQNRFDDSPFELVELFVS